MTPLRFLAILAIASIISSIVGYMAGNSFSIYGPGGTFTPRDPLIQMNDG